MLNGAWAASIGVRSFIFRVPHSEIRISLQPFLLARVRKNQRL